MKGREKGKKKWGGEGTDGEGKEGSERGRKELRGDGTNRRGKEGWRKKEVEKVEVERDGTKRKDRGGNWGGEGLDRGGKEEIERG